MHVAGLLAEEQCPTAMPAKWDALRCCCRRCPQGEIASAKQELESAQSDLSAARTAAATAAAATAAAGAVASTAADTARISELEAGVEARARELADVHAQVAVLDNKLGQLTKARRWEGVQPWLLGAATVLWRR